MPTEEKTIEGKSPLAGTVVAMLTPAIARPLRIPADTDGVVILEVYKGSPAQRFGMKAGDILLEINGAVMATVDDVVKAAESEPALWRFKINRGGAIIRQFFR